MLTQHYEGMGMTKASLGYGVSSRTPWVIENVSQKKYVHIFLLCSNIDISSSELETLLPM